MLAFELNLTYLDLSSALDTPLKGVFLIIILHAAILASNPMQVSTQTMALQNLGGGGEMLESLHISLNHFYIINCFSSPRLFEHYANQSLFEGN